ncbi:MAG: ABC-F family ATP-binding cassette domain-containing protein [Sphingomonadaceae bacterium]
MLQATNISKYFGGDTVLDGVSLELRPGERVALVGPNGAGKSTLLRILSGELEPDGGRVHRLSGTTIAYLPQNAGVTPGRTLYEEMLSLFADVIGLEEEQRRLVERMGGLSPESAELVELVERHAELHAEFERRGGYTLEAEIGRVLHGLGFTMGDYRKRVEHFSGGWQMRIALARLLLQRPDLLLLDEPTNHLDLRATEWLEGYLRQYKGAVVVVSHDRYFLDLVTCRTLELQRGRLEGYPGNYSYYAREKARRQREQEAAFKRQQAYLARQQAFIDRFHADKRRSSQTKSREKLLEKMERVEAPTGPERTIKFRFPRSTPSGRKVFELRGAGKGYDGKSVFRGCELLVEKGDRVALVGPNGAGKSTLLRLLAGVEKPEEGVVSVGANVLRAYYAQDQSESLTGSNTVLQELYAEAPRDWTLEDVRTMLGRFLFSGDDVFKSVAVLSGGERSRLALAKMLLRPSNVLLLDEPTNHLDVGSREALEEALSEYPGTVVLASHDRYLVDKLANKVVELADERATLYVGNYTNYREKKALEEAEAGRANAETRGRGDAGTRRSQRSEPRARVSPRQLQRELQAVEREIIAAEERIAELEALLASPELFSDRERSAPILAEYTELTGRLPELNARWEEIGNRLTEESEPRSGY